MMYPKTPPETYAQWLDCFSYLREHPADREMLEAVAGGSYPGRPAESYLEHLSETVSQVLTALCRRFLRQLDQALADGEPDSAPLLARRFRAQIQRCFFYRTLPFLERQYIDTLDEGFCRQLEAFWSDFLAQLGKTVRDSMDPRMEDVLLEMKRIKILQERRRGSE